MLRQPQVLPHLREAYRRGARARFLVPVQWERLWARPLDEVRALLRIEPTTVPWLSIDDPARR